jgi:hypothetical protein
MMTASMALFLAGPIAGLPVVHILIDSIKRPVRSS